MADFIISAIVIILIYFAVRRILRQRKNGGCSGCSGCSGHSCKESCSDKTHSS